MQLVPHAERQYFGSEPLDTLRDDAVGDIIAHNRRIAAALNACRKQIEAIGEPDACMAQGYDFSDILSMLRDITPTFDGARIAAVQRHVIDAEGRS